MKQKIILYLFFNFIILLNTGCSHNEEKVPKYDKNGNQIISKEWMQNSKNKYSKDISIKIDRTFIDTANLLDINFYLTNPDLKLISAPYYFNYDNEFVVDTSKERILGHYKFIQLKEDTAFYQIKSSKAGKESCNDVGILLKDNLGHFHYIDTAFIYDVIR